MKTFAHLLVPFSSQENNGERWRVYSSSFAVALDGRSRNKNSKSRASFKRQQQQQNLRWFYFEFLTSISSVTIGGTGGCTQQRQVSELAPGCMHRLCDLGHEMCLLASSEKQDQRGCWEPCGQLWHVTVFHTASPANRQERKSDSKSEINETGYLKQKYVTRNCYFDFSCLLEKGWPSWSNHVLKWLLVKFKN